LLEVFIKGWFFIVGGIMFYSAFNLSILFVFISTLNLCGMEACYNKEKHKPQDFDFVNIIFIKTIEDVDVLMENDQVITSTDTSLIPLPFRSFFGSGLMPGIPPMDYLEGLYQNLSCSPECYKLALIYINRVIKNANTLELYKVFNNISFYRMYLAAVVVAIKFHDDDFFSNAHYAVIGGVDNTEEMNILERAFLQAIKHKLFISTEEWDAFDDELIIDTSTKEFSAGPFIDYKSTDTQYSSTWLTINKFYNVASQT